MPPQPPSPLSLSILKSKFDEDEPAFDMDDDHSVTLRRPSSRLTVDAPTITTDVTSLPSSPTSPTTPTTPSSASTRSRSSTNSLSSMSSASSLSLSQFSGIRRASITDSILFSSFAETRIPTDLHLDDEDDTVYVEKIRTRRTVHGGPLTTHAPVMITRSHSISGHPRSAPSSPHGRRSSRPASPLAHSYKEREGDSSELLDMLQNLLDPKAPPPGPPPSTPLPPPPTARRSMDATFMKEPVQGRNVHPTMIPPRKDSLSRLRYVSTAV